MVSLVVITGFLTAFLNRCLLFFLFFIRIVLALLCLPGSFCSCTTNLPSTFLSFGSFGFSVAVSPPRSPTVLSPHVMGPRLSPLLSAFTSPGSLRSLCSDGQGLNAALEMIRPLCSCSGVSFCCCIFIIPSNTLLILFSVSLSLPRNSYSLFSCCLLIVSYGQPHARGVLKPSRRLRARRYGEKKEQERAGDTVNKENRFVFCFFVAWFSFGLSLEQLFCLLERMCINHGRVR